MTQEVEREHGAEHDLNIQNMRVILHCLFAMEWIVCLIRNIFTILALTVVELATQIGTNIS